MGRECLGVVSIYLSHCTMFHLYHLFGSGVPAVGRKGGPVCVLGVSRVVSLIGATSVLRFRDGWFWPCGCLVGFVRRSFVVAL